MSDLETMDNKQTTNNSISRREVLIGMGAAASLAYAGSATAAMPGHDPSTHKPPQEDEHEAGLDCLDKGERCIAHCMTRYVEGDTELAKCASKVTEMIAICNGFTYLVASNSEYAKAYSKICAQACKDCEKECREHDEHHECRACAEACEDLVKEISKAYS